MTKAKTTEEYIASFPINIRKLLTQIRKCVTASAPDAQEVISYGMPALKQNEILVYYAAHPHHIGFYPTPTGIHAFKKEIAVYTWAKGSVQFPSDKPLPLDLISRIVKFRVDEATTKRTRNSKNKS